MFGVGFVDPWWNTRLLNYDVRLRSSWQDENVVFDRDGVSRLQIHISRSILIRKRGAIKGASLDRLIRECIPGSRIGAYIVVVDKLVTEMSFKILRF